MGLPIDASLCRYRLKHFDTDVIVRYKTPAFDACSTSDGDVCLLDAFLTTCSWSASFRNRVPSVLKTPISRRAPYCIVSPAERYSIWQLSAPVTLRVEFTGYEGEVRWSHVIA